MDTPLAAWLVDALVVVGLGLVLWLFVSIPLLWIKRVLEEAGVYAFPAKVAEIANRLGVDGGAMRQFFDQADASMLRNGDQAAVRVVLDERHGDLRERLARTELSVREAVNGIQGLAGHGGGTSFLADISELRERTRLVDQLAVDPGPDIEDVYARRAVVASQLFILIPLTVVVALANGALLNVLFSEMTSMRVFGVLPMSYVFGIVVVALEIGLGIALYAFRANPLMMILLVILVFVATVFEGAAMSIFSVEFATSLRGVEAFEAGLADYWMVLLAMTFTPMTAILGFMLEGAREAQSELKGRARFASELKACNKFVDELPRRWTSIDQKARSAEAAIGRYQDALGGQDERLSGAIDTLAAERQGLSAAIVAARVEDWSFLAPGAGSDARNASVQNVLLCLLTVAGVAIYTAAIYYLVARASRGEWPWQASISVGFVTSLLFLVIGNLAFDRLRLAQGNGGTAQPMSSRGYHKAIAIVLLVGCGLGLVWACVVALGPWGVIAGVFLTALGGALCFLGYGVERAGGGLVLMVSLIAAFTVAAATGLFSVIRYAVIWVLAAIAWTIGFIVRLLAKPAEAILEWWKNRARPEPRAIEATP